MNKQTNKKRTKDVKEILQMQIHEQLLSSWQNAQDRKSTGKLSLLDSSENRSAGEGVEQRERSHAAGRTWEHAGHFLIKLNTHLHNDPAIPFLSIYPRKINTQQTWRLYTYSTFTPNCFNLETALRSATGKQTVLHPHKRPLGNEKEFADMCKHYAGLRWQTHRRHTLTGRVPPAQNSSTGKAASTSGKWVSCRLGPGE